MYQAQRRIQDLSQLFSSPALNVFCINIVISREVPKNYLPRGTALPPGKLRGACDPPVYASDQAKITLIKTVHGTN